jgi:hypothetical protein
MVAETGSFVAHHFLYVFSIFILSDTTFTSHVMFLNVGGNECDYGEEWWPVFVYEK